MFSLHIFNDYHRIFKILSYRSTREYVYTNCKTYNLKIKDSSTRNGKVTQLAESTFQKAYFLTRILPTHELFSPPFLAHAEKFILSLNYAHTQCMQPLPFPCNESDLDVDHFASNEEL